MPFITVFDLAADWSWQEDYDGFKIKGGRTIYIDAIYNSRRDNANTYIGRIEFKDGYVKQIGRYIPNSTKIELIPKKF